MRNLKPALALLAALISGHIFAAPAASVNGEIINESDLDIMKRAQIALGECKPDTSPRVSACTRNGILKRTIRNVLDRQHIEQLAKTPSALNNMPELASLRRLLTQDAAYWYVSALAQPAPSAITEQQIADYYNKQVKEANERREYSLQRGVFTSKASAEQFLGKLSTDKRAFSSEPNPLQPKASRDTFDSIRVTLPQMQDYDAGLTKSVLALKEGQNTGALKTASGWEVLKLREVYPKPLPAMAEMHDELKKTLEERSKRQFYDPFESWRKGAAIKVAAQADAPLVEVKWPELGQKDESGCGCGSDD